MRGLVHHISVKQVSVVCIVNEGSALIQRLMSITLIQDQKHVSTEDVRPFSHDCLMKGII